MWKKLFDIKGCKKRRNVEQWELDLLINTLRKLPVEYRFLIDQVETGLLKRVLTGLGDLPHWKTFGFNPEVVNKYDKPREPSFDLTNIFVFDKISNGYLEYMIGCASGMIIGYSINSDEGFDIDVTDINTQHFQKKMIASNDYFRIKQLFTPGEQKLINPSDVYEVELNRKKYYHLMDIKNGDGDFIGMDINKNIFLITHDPSEIKQLNSPIEQILSGNIDLNG